MKILNFHMFFTYYIDYAWNVSKNFKVSIKLKLKKKLNCVLHYWLFSVTCMTIRWSKLNTTFKTYCQKQFTHRIYITTSFVFFV